MYSLTHLSSFQYWFGQAPILGQPALWIMIGVFVAFLALAVIFNLFSQKDKYDIFLRRGFKKISSLLAWMGVLACALLFFRYEFVAILSRRFMFGLWFIGLAVWVGLIIRYFVKVAPRHRKIKEEKERIAKYLP